VAHSEARGSVLPPHRVRATGGDLGGSFVQPKMALRFANTSATATPMPATQTASTTSIGST
jgi:hypothetical protein